MAYTNAGRVAVQQHGLPGASRWLSLHLADGTELTAANGYARYELTESALDAAVQSDGSFDFTNIDFYTATTASAQDADQIALYSAATGGDQLMTPEDLTVDVAAPANGQTFRLTTLTLNP